MLRKIARPLMASAFIADGVQMVKSPQNHAKNAEVVTGTLRKVLPPQAAALLPRDAETNVRIAGGTKIAAAALLARGKAPRLAAAALAAAHLPAILTRHDIKNVAGKGGQNTQLTTLLADVGLLGGLLIAAEDTAGKPGLAWRAQQALPGRSQQQEMLATAQGYASDFSEKARELASEASDNISSAASAVSDYVDEHSDEWRDTAYQVRDQASAYAETFAEELQDSTKGLSKKAKKKAKKLK